MLLSKFRGTMLGALVGDCMGAQFEGEIMDSSARLVLRQNLDRLQGPYFRAPYKKYTDDTAMAKCTALAFLEPTGFSQKQLAKNYTLEYFKEPNRGYGAAVGEVFQKLRKTKLADPIDPAAQQFNGTGSYGNGAAMRIMPVSLACFAKNREHLRKLTTDTALITHSHKLAINGAYLEALAIYESLHLDPNNPFDHNQFLNNLINEIVLVEKENDPDFEENINAYEIQLKAVQSLLANKDEAHDQNVISTLGNNVTALHSVPTAIYCFLRNTDSAQAKNTFRNTLEYAISLGGDTDTIASMACSITGAYYGDSVIPENLIKHCEDYGNVAQLAEKLYEMYAK